MNNIVYRSLAPRAGRGGGDVEARPKAVEHSLLSRLLSQAREEVQIDIESFPHWMNWM
jgi:hypothetical protein